MKLSELYIDLSGNPTHKVEKNGVSTGVVLQKDDSTWIYQFSLGHITYESHGDYDTKEEAAEELIIGFSKMIFNAYKQLNLN